MNISPGRAKRHPIIFSALQTVSLSLRARVLGVGIERGEPFLSVRGAPGLRQQREILMVRASQPAPAGARYVGEFDYPVSLLVFERRMPDPERSE